MVGKAGIIRGVRLGMDAAPVTFPKEPVPDWHVHKVEHGEWDLCLDGLLTQCCITCGMSLTYLGPWFGVVQSNDHSRRVYWVYTTVR